MVREEADLRHISGARWGLLFRLLRLLKLWTGVLQNHQSAQAECEVQCHYPCLKLAILEEMRHQSVVYESAMGLKMISEPR